MIPEWLSFCDEFISSPYIFLYLFTWYRKDNSLPFKWFWNEFIPRFSIQLQFLFWYEVLSWLQVNWKRNSIRIEISQTVWSRRAVHAYLARKLSQRCRLTRSILSCECSTNIILERNPYLNKRPFQSHAYKQPIQYVNHVTFIRRVFILIKLN